MELEGGGHYIEKPDKSQQLWGRGYGSLINLPLRNVVLWHLVSWQMFLGCGDPHTVWQEQRIPGYTGHILLYYNLL